MKDENGNQIQLSDKILDNIGMDELVAIDGN